MYFTPLQMLETTRIEEVLRRGPAVGELVKRWREVDERRRALQATLDRQRAERNAANQRMAKADKKSPEFAADRDSLRELSQRIKSGEEELTRLEAESEGVLLVIPNAPHASVPDGQDEQANRIESSWGQKPVFEGFTPRPHWEIGEMLGILDFGSAAKI